jgi:hypothetical protein
MIRLFFERVSLRKARDRKSWKINDRFGSKETEHLKNITRLLLGKEPKRIFQ